MTFEYVIRIPPEGCWNKPDCVVHETGICFEDVRDAGAKYIVQGGMFYEHVL